MSHLALAASLAIASLAVLSQEVKPLPPPGLCIDDTGKCTPTAPEPGDGVKWHPGHYMLVYLDAPQQVLNDLRTEPYVKGAQIRYRWSDLEIRRGVYDFSRIEADLRYLESMPTPKRLVLQILDRKFNSTDPHGVVPDYMLQESAFNGGIAQTKNGYIARVWEPAVMDRLIALYAALAARFDREAYIEGITTEEITPGFAKQVPPASYSPAALRLQTSRLIAAARQSWKSTNVFIYTNSLAGELGSIIKEAYANGCGVGGPDVIPTNPLPGDLIINGTNGNFDYRGRTPIAYAVQSPALCGKEGCHSPEEIYNYAMNQLGANYLFWIRMGKERDTATAKYSWSDGILPVIRAKGGLTKTSCPSNLQGRCITG